MKKLTVLIFACLMFAANTFAQSADEKQVAAAVEFLRKAMIDGDRTNLNKLAADDLMYCHSNGKVENKAQFVEALASGASDFVTIDLSEQVTKISGTIAMVHLKLVAQTNDGGKPGTTNLGVMLVYQKQKGEWKLLARQAFKTPVAQ